MNADVLDARALFGAVTAPLVAAPAVLRRRDPPPITPGAVTVTIHRQPLSFAAEPQAAMLDLWRKNRRSPPPDLHWRLTESGILRHCGVLQAAPDGPLVFRRIAEETVRVFGTAWAMEQLGRPNEADPNSEYALQLAAEYDEAIDGGQPVYNHLVIHGLSQPIIYSHMLVGWTSSAGQKALIACIDWPGL